MRAFLIDFENVKSAGLVGIDTLGIDDQVVILYSVNSNTISFEMHQKIMSCAANVEYYQIRRGGKNSLDFQLSTMLGYLLASGLYSHLYIISNDSGFDALYDFWTSQYIPTDCVVYRRPNIALSVAHSLFTGKQLKAPDEAADGAVDVDVTTGDSGAYDGFEMGTEDTLASIKPIQVEAKEVFPEPEEKPEEPSEPDGEPAEESSFLEQAGEPEQTVEQASEQALEPDDIETAALLGALQAARLDEEQELNAVNEEPEDELSGMSAAARMRKAELDAEEEEMYIPAEILNVASREENAEEERPRRRRGRPRRGSVSEEHAEKEPSYEKPKRRADPAEVAALSGKLEGELGELCNKEQLSAVAETILLSEGKQEFYRGIIRRFGQKKGLQVYKAVKSDFSGLKKK